MCRSWWGGACRSSRSRGRRCRCFCASAPSPPSFCHVVLPLLWVVIPSLWVLMPLPSPPLQVCATPCYGHRLCVDGGHVWVIVCKEMDAEQQQWLHDGVHYDSEPDIDATTSDMMLLKLV